MATIAITGASGRIGTAVRPLLARPGRTLRLIDVAEPDTLIAGEEVRVVDVDDEHDLTAAFEGADAVVHLAGIPSERPWPDLLAANIHGTYTALTAAHRAGIDTVMLASSIHAVGSATLADVAAEPVPAPRPDTLYGVSKVAVEGLGHTFAHRCRMRIVSARICYFSDTPGTGLNALIWVSPGDLVRLIEATLALPRPGHHVVWGVSRQADPWLRPDAGHVIGYHAADTANVDQLPPDRLLKVFGLSDDTRLGGTFLTTPLGTSE